MRLAGVAAMVAGAVLIYFVFVTPRTLAGNPAPPAGSGNALVPTPAPSSGGLDPASLAQSQLGKRYVFGAATDPTLQTLVYDCSSLVQGIFQKLGFKNVPRTSQQQAAVATPVSSPSIGDLVFGSFAGLNDHVGIYVGSGKVVSALDEAHGVVTSNADNWPGVHYGRFA